MWDAIYKYSVLLLVLFRICVGSDGPSDSQAEHSCGQVRTRANSWSLRGALPSLKTRLCAIYRAGQLIAAKPTKGVKCCGADGHLCATGRGESLVRRNIDATASQLKWVRTQLSATVVCGMVCGMDVSDDDVDK
jgi:hypothetical protein